VSGSSKEQNVRVQRTRPLVAAIATLLSSIGALGCRSGNHDTPAVKDSGFAKMQARGKVAMGVDQYTSAHRFEDLPDGGRIELQRDPKDSAGVQTIREHLQTIATAFSAGDFSVPGFVHADSVPCTATMRTERAAIRYQYAPLPGGGEVRITARNSAAVAAVHDFLAYQRHEHHVSQESR
jgi:hypothetical protein